MARKTTDNRFSSAGQALVNSGMTTNTSNSASASEKDAPAASRKKDKVITAKVYPDTWATFTAINRAQGMTNNSVINMLISNYIRDKKEILE